MKQIQYAEIHALDRVLELLEEGSFRYLSLKDDEFASFIEQLYTQVNRQANKLEARQI